MAGRIAWLDWARSLGIIAVVAGHILTGWISSAIFLFHMPLFFMLSGVTFHALPLHAWAKRRSWSLGLPYLAYAVILAILAHLYAVLGLGGGEPISVGTIVRGGQFMRGLGGTLWFLSCVFFSLLIYNILRRRVSSPLAPGIVAPVLIMFVLSPWIAPVPLPLAVNVVPAALFCIWSGEVYRENRPSLWLTCCLAVLAIPLALTLPPIDMKYGKLGLPYASLLFGCGLSVLFMEACRYLSKSLGRISFMEEISKGSLVIMAVHPAFYIPLRVMGLPVLNFILSLALSIGLYLLFRRLPAMLRAPLLGERIVADHR